MTVYDEGVRRTKSQREGCNLLNFERLCFIDHYLNPEIILRIAVGYWRPIGQTMQNFTQSYRRLNMRLTPDINHATHTHDNKKFVKCCVNTTATLW